jgi:hypothetical protein
MTRTIAKCVITLFFVAGFAGFIAIGSNASAINTTTIYSNLATVNFELPEAAHRIWQNPPPGNPQDDKKAEEVYKNIQIFKGLPASRIMGAMQFFARSLGVKCDHCHIQGQFDKDEKPTKLTARKMYKMVRFATDKGAKGASCYMCHAGHTQPEPSPDMTPEKMEAMMKQADKDQRPVEQAFKNIQVLKGLKAGRLMMTMQLFTKALGVQCTHCHVQADFSKDDQPAKQTARQMLTMVGGMTTEFFNGQPTVNCFTCHKGQVKPVAFPPQKQGN